jgi:hypothetical protein
MTNVNMTAAHMMLNQKAAELTNALIGATTAAAVILGVNLRLAKTATMPVTLEIANMSAALKEVLLNQKAAQKINAQIMEMIAAQSHQEKTGDGMSHKLAKMVTTLFLKAKTDANTNAALFLMNARKINVLIMETIAALNLQAKTGDGMSHRPAKMVTSLFQKDLKDANTVAALMDLLVLLMNQKAAEGMSAQIGVTTAAAVMLGVNLKPAKTDTMPVTLEIATMNAALKEDLGIRK